MKKQLLLCDNLGMTKDTSIGYLSKDSNTGITLYAYNNYNIRITAINDNTQLSITNEKGPNITGTLDGTFLGSCKLNEVLVVFTHEQNTNTDRIYKITYNNLIKLYEGNLNFSLLHPIEAIGYYESSEVWKVYWVDGYNRNRFINIAATDEERTKWNDYSFDFQGLISAIPNVKITKDYSKSGYFIAGVIQYFITYYNKLGVETPIVWSSDIQYISMLDRGAKPDEDVNCAFNFEISNVDSQYLYIRIYSVYRSSENDTADAKIVSEIKIEDNQNTLLYTDYGYQGLSIDTLDLFYIGGLDLRANTLDYKLDTLFLGDITISDLLFPENIKTVIESNKLLVEIPELNNTLIYDSNLLSWKYKLCKLIQNLEPNNKQFLLQNSLSTVAGFKCGEVYRFAIQLQTVTGEWTIPYWLGDKFCNLKPVYKEASEEGIRKIKFPNYPDKDYQVYYANVNGLKYYFCYLATNDEDIFAWKTSKLLYEGLTKLYFLPDYTEDIIIYPSVYIKLFEETDIPEGSPYEVAFAYKVFNFRNYQSDTIKLELENYQEIKLALDSLVGINVYNYYNNLGLDLYEVKAIPELIFTNNGYIVPTITFNGTNNLDWQNGILSLSGQYISYRLLIADTNISNRRIVALGVINPTMFNYNDRANNRPFSFNSWVFRPRNSKMLNRHFDALPVQTDKYAELLGIMSKKVPGFSSKINSEGSDQENAFVLLFAPNLSNASCRLGYSLIYYNTNNCTYSAQDRLDFYNATKNKEIKRNTETGTEIVSASTYWNAIINDSALYSNGLFLTLLRSQAIAAIAADNNFFTGITDPTDITAPSYGITGATVVSLGLIKKASWSKILLELLTKIGNDLKSLGKEMILSEAMLPTAELYKDAWFVSNGSEIGAWIGLSIATAVAVVATVLTAGAASTALAAVAAGTASMSSAIALSVTSSIAALGAIAGGAGLGAFATEVEKLKGIDKELAYKSITCLTPNHTIAERRQCQDRVVSLLTNMFDSNIAEEAKKNFIMKNANFGSLGVDSNLYMLGGVLNTVSPTEEDKLDKRNQFYVDESIVTINSPELEDVNILNLINNSDGLQLNLVGTIPINSVYGEYDMQTLSNGLANNALVIKNEFLNSNQDIEGILNGNFYQDSIWPSSFSVEDGNIPILASAIVLRYKVFMWNRNTSWSLWFNNAKIKDVFGEYITEAPALPKRKLFANYKYSSYTHYNDSQILEIDSPKVFSDNQTTIMPFNYNGYQKYYQGNVDTIVTTDTNYTLINDLGLEFHKNNEGVVDINLKDPVSIKFKSTPHAVIPLKWKTGLQSTILPYLDPKDKLFPKDLYDEFDDSTNDYSILGVPKIIPINNIAIPINNIITIPDLSTKWERTWYLELLPWKEDSPYLFMGEIIKKDFDYDNWNGGISEYALQQLTWNVCSSSTDLTKDIFNTWGDTYYQRWECLKTYPFTEEDKNSVVDILSFMVESHINVDGRCDINKGTSNILNARPTNFNILNQVYSLKDNIFSYLIVEGNVKNKKHFENEVVWSLTKNPLDSVDNWTNLNAANSIYLNGEYGPVRKILSSEDSLIAFQDSSISTIDYNEKTALATSAGVPLLLSNTGKVTGYTKVSDKIGCLNKFSINSNSAGIFFVDDYNKTFNVFSRGKGIQCLSLMKNFSKWFKDNILVQLWTPQYSAFRASYDELTHDLYLSDNSKCLVYNTYLNLFTSFMDYLFSPVITNLHGKSVILHSTNDNNNVLVGNMFEGDYNVFFGEYKGYSLEYRVDSPTNEDTLFTNYNFIADWVNPNTISDDYNQFNSVDRFKTFDRVQAWNEYLFGEMRIPTNRVGRYKIKTKFREWYGDIPRDGYTLLSTSIHSDRLRNPWIHLKFIKDNNDLIKDTSKMTFYKLLITYYN